MLLLIISLIIASSMTLQPAEAEQPRHQVRTQAEPELPDGQESLFQDVLDELRAIHKIQDDTYNEHLLSKSEWEKRETGSGQITSELDAMYRIKNNTTQNFWSTGVTMMALLALVVSLVTLFVSLITYKQQKRTADNTQHLSVNSRLFYLTQYLIRLWRDYINLRALQCRLEKCGYGAYPTEAFLEKMKLSLDGINMVMDCSQDTDLNALYELKQVLENYNHDVDEAMAHLKDGTVPRKIKEEDINNLLYKAGSFVGKQIVMFSMHIYGREECFDSVRVFFDRSIECLRPMYRIDGPDGARVFISDEDRSSWSTLRDIFGDDKLKELCQITNNEINRTLGKDRRGINCIRFITPEETRVRPAYLADRRAFVRKVR